MVFDGEGDTWQWVVPSHLEERFQLPNMEPIGLCVAVKHPGLIVKTAVGCRSGSLFHENVKERTSLGGSWSFIPQCALWVSEKQGQTLFRRKSYKVRAS